jgi:hypothetical protein
MAPRYDSACPGPSGKTSNRNLVLSQMIFDNPSNDTYFREIMSNLRILLKRNYIGHKEQQGINVLQKYNICMSVHGLVHN